MAAADFIQEAAPEREDLKISLFREIGEIARPDVDHRLLVLGLPAVAAAVAMSASRAACIIGHPFNPVYLLPLVEDVARRRQPASAHGRGRRYSTPPIGMHVLRLKKEIPAIFATGCRRRCGARRCTFSTRTSARPATSTTRIVYSAGLRWAFMGSFLTYHLAGGPGGMRDFIRQFDPSLELPWTDLGYPKWSDNAGAATDRGLRNPGGRPFGRRDRGQAQRGPGRPAAAAEATPDRRRPGTPARGGGQGQAPASQALEGRRQDRRADQIMERHRGRGLPRL